MSVDSTKLLEFLGEIDRELEHKVVLVAVGGTAMTLLKTKPSTIDIDFTVPSTYFEDFEGAMRSVGPGFRVDLFRDGAVFVTILPEDYLEKSRPIQTSFKNIELRALDPVDIVITKIARLDKRDEQDIVSCIDKFKLSKDQIKRRAKQMAYSGGDEVFRNNLKTVLKKFFK